MQIVRSREVQKLHHEQGIPLDMIRRLNAITNEKQLFDEFVNVQSPKRAYGSNSEYGRVVRVGRVTDIRQYERDIENENNQPIVTASVSGITTMNKPRTINVVTSTSESNETSKSETPKPATCAPELRTVNLKESTDDTIYYYPSCTRVDRCGGCCGSELLSCQATQIQFINYTVHIFEYNGKPVLEHRGSKIVTVDKHIKCKCDCKIKAKDCKSLHQKYEEKKCRCTCTNREEEQNCLQQNDSKVWNGSTCTCECRQIHECTTLYYFDENTCSCVRNPQSIQPAYRFDGARYDTAYDFP
ncbi:hypothetical protein PGB90_008534 [Kerria lacca]